MTLAGWDLQGEIDPSKWNRGKCCRKPRRLSLRLGPCAVVSLPHFLCVCVGACIQLCVDANSPGDEVTERLLPNVGSRNLGPHKQFKLVTVESSL